MFYINRRKYLIVQYFYEVLQSFLITVVKVMIELKISDDGKLLLSVTMTFKCGDTSLLAVTQGMISLRGSYSLGTEG